VISPISSSSMTVWDSYFARSARVGASAARQKMAAVTALEAIDADKSGSISKDEFVKAAQETKADASTLAAVFQKADANGDGSLSLDEMPALMQMAQAQAASTGQPATGRGKPAGGMRGPSGAEGGGGGGKSVGATSSTTSSAVSTDPADTNGDGKVSFAERVAYQLKQLQKYSQSSTSPNSGLIDVVA
jgi:hypothetical protein